MIFFKKKKNGQQTIEDGLDIFSKATEKLQAGIELIKAEENIERNTLRNHEIAIADAEYDFKKEQEQKAKDFAESQAIEKSLCDVVRKNVQDRCKTLEADRNKATKVIKNIQNLLA